MKALTAQNAALVKSETDRAKATVIAAKADGQVIVNQSKRQKSANDTAIAEAKAAKIAQGSASAAASSSATTTRRDAIAAERVLASQAITQARVTTETVRTATAQQNLAAATTRAGSATEMAAARSQRLADGTRAAQSGTLALNDSLSNSRYLLYDVGQTYTVLSTALLAIPTATAAVAIAYEKDFAQVQRTNDTLKDGNGFADLRKDLKELATEIPLTFDEFSKISTIGGQLGIGGKDIESFTETVARFGAASNVSLDQASTAFGRFQNSFDPKRLDPDFFNKIGSAVAYVGVKSAATETEIIAVSNQISAAGAQFGFTADEVVGLSGALASVRIRPELARGAFQRIMLGLGGAADKGAESFNKFGKYTGLAAEESMNLFKTDPSAFFYKYIGGIKNAIKETGSVSGVLEDIGAKNVFDKQFILGLANGYNVFGDSLKNASESFNEGTFLKDSTQGVFDTMDAKLKRISSSISNVMDTLAKGAVGQGSGLAKIADAFLAITGAADRFLQATPGFTAFVNIVLGLGSAVGILLAFKAAQAFVLAGLVGFQQVLGKGTLAAGLTAKGILQQLAVTLLMHKGLTQADAQAVVLQAGAFRTMGMSAATANTQLLGASAGAGTVTRNVAAAVGPIGRFTGGLAAAGKGALSLVGGPLGILLTALTVIGLGFVQAEEKANSAGDAIARAMQNGADAGNRAIGDALTSRTVDSWITDVGSGGVGNHGKNVRQLADEIGISFDDIVNSIGKGEDASNAFGSVLDSYSQKKGFKDFADLQSKSFTNLDNKKGELQFLANVVEELGKKSAESTKDVKAVDKAAGDAGDSAANAAPNAEALTTEFESMGEEADTAATKIDKFIDKIFGIINASAGTQAALQTLGEGLANSSNFGAGTEGGRENIKNFQDALKAAALEQQQLIDTTGKSTQQASADYMAFVDGLVQQMAAKGVDPARVQSLANQVKGMFGSTLLSGPQPEMPVTVNPAQVTVAAATVMESVQSAISGHNSIDVMVGANVDPASFEIQKLARALAAITGIPYTTVVDALTNPAHEKAAELQALIQSITEGKYEVPVGANTEAAVQNVKNFADYARKQLAAVQAAYNNVAASAPTFAKYTKPFFKGVTGVTQSPMAPAATAPSVAQVAAPVQVKASSSPAFGSLVNGYDKVKAAAQKAGKAGKQAAEDMADGISDATRAANDYANRLKSGLQSAFDQQYGVTKATDEYHTALNAINKKREDEIAQVADLITKQKELNDARKEELINARKAGIEKNISMKYGEVDRAADYGAQETKALDAAAAKQKDIDANNKQLVSLRAGIGQLNGYSDAAIANRAALRDLESKMTDMVVAYANTGASVDQVRVYAQNLTGQFKTDVAQMGYNQTAVGNLQGSLERYIGVINRVPLVKPTKVEADTTDASNDIGGVQDQLDRAGQGVVIPVTADVGSFEWHVAEAIARAERNLQLTLADPVGTGSSIGGRQNGSMRGGAFRGGNVGAVMRGLKSGGMVPGRAPSNPNVDNLVARVDGKGQIGLRSEEFVMQQPAVKYWGSDFMNAVNNMQALPHFNGGGSLGGSSSGGGGGSMVVALDAETLAFLASLQQDIKLYADSKELASAVNKGNRQLVAEGMNQ
jgi:TP901 family phage tail tape measure protein